MMLHNACKDLIGQYGAVIIRTSRCIIFLSDLQAFEKYPVTKTIFKDLIEKRYCEKIYQLYIKNKHEAATNIVSIINQYLDETVFRKEQVCYIFDCILYGLGCIDHVNEPLLSGLVNSSEEILNTLSEQLSDLQKQYIDLLNKLVILPKDIIYDSPAYFSTQAKNQLYAIEAKIAVLSQQLRTNEPEWCSRVQSIFLDKHIKQKDNAVRDKLSNEKIQYQSLLNNLLIKPKIFFIKKSGYYNASGIQELLKLEKKIKILYANISDSNNNWCEKEKKATLYKYNISGMNMLLQIFFKVVLPLVIVVFGGMEGCKYTDSRESINHFEQTMITAKEKVVNNDYKNALRLFQQAKNEYIGSFRTEHYKNLANKQMKEAIFEAFSKANQALQNRKYLETADILSQIPKDSSTKGTDYTEKFNQFNETLKFKVKEEINILIKNISNNHGKLMKDDLNQLNNLLTLSPNDYWLNFIKKKSE